METKPKSRSKKILQKSPRLKLTLENIKLSKLVKMVLIKLGQRISTSRKSSKGSRLSPSSKL